MKMKPPFLSICVPNYNRPQELLRMLSSIDSKNAESVEIVIIDDKSPLAQQVKEVVAVFIKNSLYRVVFKENKNNLGYDKNLKELVKLAAGEWIIFMGNDDEFVPGALDKLIGFLKNNSGLGYVLKSHERIYPNGKAEKFRYFESNKFFKPGYEAYISLFRTSVFISGFTIRRNPITNMLVDNFDGTLLFQLYLMAETVLKNKSAYFDEPLTRGYEGGIPEFGSSKSEQSFYTPGTVTVENSLNFLRGFFKITQFMDKKYGFDSTPDIKKDMSKYFYPSLAIQRNKGLKVFLDYVSQLNKIGFNRSIYYYIYVTALIVLGKSVCDNIIRILKNLLGKTPKL